MRGCILTIVFAVVYSVAFAQSQGYSVTPPTVTLVQQAVPVGTASPGASVGVFLPANATAGNLVVFSECSQPGNAVTSISVFGTTATKLFEERVNAQVGVWAIVVPNAAATATVNLTNGSPFSVTMQEFSTTGTWTPLTSDPNLPASSTQQTFGNQIFTPMVSTAYAWDLLYATPCEGASALVVAPGAPWIGLTGKALNLASLTPAYMFASQGGMYQALFTNLSAGSFNGAVLVPIEVH